MRRLRLFAGGVTLVFGLLANPVGAMTATLGQTVEPITCVYTVIDSGDSVSSSTACDSVVPATLDTVNPRAGRPLLGGTVTTVSLASLRVGVGDRWYTLGANEYFTSNAGVWRLDLATLAIPLSAGVYTVVLEERTTSDFLLRSVYSGALVVPVAEVTRTDTSDGRGIESHYDAPKGYDSLAWTRKGLIDAPLLSGVDPGVQIYISDTAELSDGRYSCSWYIFWLAAMTMFGYIGYLVLRMIRDRNKQ